MANFGELKTRIANKLNRADLTSQIAAAINSTIEYFQPTHTWFNDATAAITLTAGNPLVPNIPSDFLYQLEDDALVIQFAQQNYILIKKSPVEFDCYNEQGSGIPFIYTNKNGNLYVYFLPDQAYTLNLYYVKSYPSLVADADSNDWTVNAPRLIEDKTIEDINRYQLKDFERADNVRIDVEREMKVIMARTAKRNATGNLLISNYVGGFYNDYYSG